VNRHIVRAGTHHEIKATERNQAVLEDDHVTEVEGHERDGHPFQPQLIHLLRGGGYVNHALLGMGGKNHNKKTHFPAKAHTFFTG